MGGGDANKESIPMGIATYAQERNGRADNAYDAVAILYGVQIYQRWIDLVNRRKLSIQHRKSLKMWEKKQTGECHER